MERRRRKRHQFRMEVKVQSVGRKYLANPVKGWTRDVNSRGLLVEIKKRLSQGMRMELAMHLPAEVTGRPVLLMCHCRVVRLAGSGVAVVIENFDYVRASEEP